MNTRIQVEHPVTEMITGVDIVEKQFQIACGDNIGLSQNEITRNGHAIECRVYAENPSKNFMPSPGKIQFYFSPQIKGVRIESALENNTEVFSFFDPMISKLVVWGENRELARKKMQNLLNNYTVHGIDTNIDFLKELILNKDFVNNQISTSYCDKNLDELIESIKKRESSNDLIIPLVGFLLFDLKRMGTNASRTNTLWTEIGYWRQRMEIPAAVNNKNFEAHIKSSNSNNYELIIENKLYLCQIVNLDKFSIKLNVNEEQHELFISHNERGIASISFKGQIFKAKRKNVLVESDISLSSENIEDNNQLISPMPGTVLKINANIGYIVAKGAKLIVIESMKMENNITTGRKAKVSKINVKEGELVAAGTVLIELEEI